MVLSTIHAAGDIFYATELNEINYDIKTLLAKTRQVSLTAYNAIVPDTNSATLAQSEMSTNKFPLPYAIYSSVGTQRLCWITHFEESWNSSNVTATLEATIPSHKDSTSAWVISGKRVTANTQYDVAIPSTGIITVNHGSGAYYRHMGGTEPTMLLTGSGNTVIWEIKRGISTDGDDLSTDAHFVSCKILYGVI
jgi:hypothetical protein